MSITPKLYSILNTYTPLKEVEIKADKDVLIWFWSSYSMLLLLVGFVVSQYQSKFNNDETWDLSSFNFHVLPIQSGKKYSSTAVNVCPTFFNKCTIYNNSTTTRDTNTIYTDPSNMINGSTTNLTIFNQWKCLFNIIHKLQELSSFLGCNNIGRSSMRFQMTVGNRSLILCHVKTCAMEQLKLKVKTRWSWKVVILYFVSIACCCRFSSNYKSNNWQAVEEIGALKKENKSKKNKYEKEEEEEENKSEKDDEGEEYHNKPKIT
ncbi:hypothetical protein ACTFIR_002841 [Dictyostelium discoideum]